MVPCCKVGGSEYSSTLDGLYITIRASLVAELVKNPPAMQETPVQSWVGKICCRRDRLPTPVFLGFPGGSDVKESVYSMRDLGSISGAGRSPGGGHGNSFQYSCLENPHGQRSLAGYIPWSCKESDTTEHLRTPQHISLSMRIISEMQGQFDIRKIKQWEHTTLVE